MTNVVGIINENDVDGELGSRDVSPSEALAVLEELISDGVSVDGDMGWFIRLETGRYLGSIEYTGFTGSRSALEPIRERLKSASLL